MELSGNGTVNETQNHSCSVPEQVFSSAEKPEDFTLLAISIPISREGTSENALIIPTAEEIALALKEDTEIGTVRH